MLKSRKNLISSFAYDPYQSLSLFSKITGLKTRFVDFGGEKSHLNLIRIKMYHIESKSAGFFYSSAGGSKVESFKLVVLVSLPRRR
ncbi:hypothetical protein H5410_034953 [Solanum commersonii]|uniref:Uncharacterized protein n=1 Tax=Solanum commersonii TaxID=4109 RepID=A0A9J5XZV9_SOLCO|nr:hypothetical protein H5410_034953 [Solanum commersonii]